MGSVIQVRSEEGSRFLRPHTDPRSRGRQGRLERSLLRLHGLLVLSFAAFTLLPLGRPDHLPSSEVALRLVLAGLQVGLAVDLQRRGERVEHLAVTLVAAVLGMGPWVGSLPGDVTGGLAYSSFALCTARLMRTRWFLLTLLLTGAVGILVRAASGMAHQPLGQNVDTWLLTVSLTSSAAVFVDSLEERSRRAEDLHREARARELELRETRERASAADLAGRVLHDDVLGVLHLVGDVEGDGEEHERVRRACGRTVASVQETVGAREPSAYAAGTRRGAR